MPSNHAGMRDRDIFLNNFVKESYVKCCISMKHNV